MARGHGGEAELGQAIGRMRARCQLQRLKTMGSTHGSAPFVRLAELGEAFEREKPPMLLLSRKGSARLGRLGLRRSHARAQGVLLRAGGPVCSCGSQACQVSLKPWRVGPTERANERQSRQQGAWRGRVARVSN